jgi:hypothetical protein
MPYFAAHGGGGGYRNLSIYLSAINLMRNVSIDLECFNNNLSPEKLETETRQEISQRRTPKQMEAHGNVLGVRPVLNTKS